jgi:hypothetical protein
MTFFYDLNKKLAGISEQPAGKQQVNEGGLSSLARSIGGAVKKVKTVAKDAGGAALNKVGHGSDADMIRDLQRKMGLPQTGEKPQQVKEKLSPAKAKNFAALAEPKDKITFADKIAGAKKEVDEMLGDVAAEAIKSALTPKQKKLDRNGNGKIDGQDLAMLRKGGKKEVADEASTGDYSAKKGAAGKDLGKPGKNFGKIAKGAAERYGSAEAGKRVAGAVLNKLRHKNEGEMDEGWDEMERDVKGRMGQMKTGEKVQGHKGEIEKTATGIRHTRRYDDKTGVTDTGDDTPAAGEKRGRGRPKKTNQAPERVTAKATKHKGGRKVTDEGDFGPMEGAGEGNDMVKLAKVIASCTTQAQLDTARRMAQNFLKKHQTGDLAFYGDDMKRGMAVSKDIAKKRDEIGGQELDEKAVSKKQQKFMGMVHATQKGEKAPSKEVAKVAKTMKKKDAEDFASTKHKGLPEKKKPEAKKEEGKKEDKPKKVKEEGGAGTPTASSGFSYGKGIYDSMNFELEQMIAESMSINMSDSTEGGKSLTVTATDDDALQLASMLNNAGMGGEGGHEMGMDHEAGACPSCGEAPCGCDGSDGEVEVEVDENQPNWPTNTETSNNAMQYSGGLNKPKTDVAGDGQTTVPVTATHSEEEEILRKLREASSITKVAEQEQVVAIEEDEEELDESFEQTLNRMRGIAGIKEAKKPDFLDVDKDGDEKEPFKKAVKDKEEKKVEESIFALTNQWKAYKG